MSNQQNTISNYQKKKCLNVLDKLTSYGISCMFLTPVDPERDQCANYFDVIKHPMDLQTVRKKLESNKYATVSQFKDDVNLIWENAYRYNGKKSIVSLLARQLQTIFKEITEFLTNNEICDWANQLESIKNEVNLIAKNCPTGSSVQFSSYAGLSPQPSTRISSRQSEQSYNSETTAQNESSYNAKKSPPKKSHSVHSQQPQQEKQAPSHPKLSKKSPKFSNHAILGIDNQQNSSIRSSHSLFNLPLSKGETENEKPPETNKNASPLNEAELEKLIDDIQSISDVKIMNKIINMIKIKNPSINLIENDFNEIEIKVSDIKNSTLIEVQKYVESLFVDENDDGNDFEDDHNNDDEL